MFIRVQSKVDNVFVFQFMTSCQSRLDSYLIQFLENCSKDVTVSYVSSENLLFSEYRDQSCF